MCIASEREIFDLSNNFLSFAFQILLLKERNLLILRYVPTNLTTLYCYLIRIPWLLILRMIQRSYFLPFTIKLIRLFKSMDHWHNKHVTDHTLEPSSAVYKSWVVGERHCSFSTHWFISTSQHHWLHSSVGWSVPPISRRNRFKPCWSPDIFRFLYTQVHKLLSQLRGS